MKEWTKQEREQAVREIVSRFPYQASAELMDSDGDSIENIAVNLAMENNEARELLEDATCSTWTLGSKRVEWLKRNTP